MSVQEAELLQDDVLRLADERLAVSRHVVRMLRNPDYLTALEAIPTEPGAPADEVLAKYL
jgi:hypothetical protein